MSGTEWMVVLGGAVAIVWVNWYFFLASTKTPARTRAGDAKEES